MTEWFRRDEDGKFWIDRSHPEGEAYWQSFVKGTVFAEAEDGTLVDGDAALAMLDDTESEDT